MSRSCQPMKSRKSPLNTRFRGLFFVQSFLNINNFKVIVMLFLPYHDRAKPKQSTRRLLWPIASILLKIINI